MKSEILKIIGMKNFFNVLSISSNNARYILKHPSILLISNVYNNWLKTILAKTEKHFPILIDTSVDAMTIQNSKNGVAFFNSVSKSQMDEEIEHDLSTLLPESNHKCLLSIILPQTEIIQYFLQWQKYRKYCWSSISTTPGLFSLNDYKIQNGSGQVNIVAQFPWGKTTVEAISVSKYLVQGRSKQTYGRLDSEFSLEGALMILLLDGLMNQTKEHYLRLNRSVAPYKMSFTVAYKDKIHKETLAELANHLNHKLRERNISTWLPDFSFSAGEQLLINRQLGIQYIAVLDDQTLSNGIFHLMNSSTMLMEQVHVADFESYMALICKD